MDKKTPPSSRDLTSLIPLQTVKYAIGPSHPSVKFSGIEIVEGPLSNMQAQRQEILSSAVSKTLGDFSGSNADSVLRETLFSERRRLRQEKFNPFTYQRIKGDRALWGKIQADLRKAPAEVDSRKMLEQVVAHYAEEIGGHFDPSLYKFAVRAVPWGFNWLLNAASVKRFIPFAFTESLGSQLQIVGEVELLQKLSKKGTVLLVPTHQSNIDSVMIGYIIYLMSLPPFCYGAGLNLFSNPVLSFFMSRLGAYTVDRKKPHPLYKQVLKNYSSEVLYRGVHSIFFPGGGRSRSGAIESKLKLGLLGTGLEAQVNATLAGRPNSQVFVVPMVMSYHFVLEASSLIEDFLSDSGAHRFSRAVADPFSPLSVPKFFWKLFSAQSGMSARVGRPLDIFGNFVDEDGRSLGPNGTTIDPKKWLTTNGKFGLSADRDREYTVRLGEKLVERYHSENTVLSSHIVAFSLFELLRENYRDLDLYRFLRLSLPQRTVTFAAFMGKVERVFEELKNLESRGKLHIADEVKTRSVEDWVKAGALQLGLFHEVPPVVLEGGLAYSEDLQNLYYYRNRLAGYQISLLGKERGSLGKPGQYDSKGFLA